VIAALQDEGYIISTANHQLGLITGSLEITDTHRWDKFWRKNTYRTARRVEASATIQVRADLTRIRINIVAKALTKHWRYPLVQTDNGFARVSAYLPEN
jgi:hypothetical protein